MKSGSGYPTSNQLMSQLRKNSRAGWPHIEVSSECLPRHPAVAYLRFVRPMRAFIFALFLLATISFASADKDIEKYAQWITGDMLLWDGILAFRADKPVQDNRTGDVVLVGP